MLEAALSDAAERAGPTVSNAAIQKGSTILDTYRVESTPSRRYGQRMARASHGGTWTSP
jgi:hypothetical protein